MAVVGRAKRSVRTRLFDPLTDPGVVTAIVPVQGGRRAQKMLRIAPDVYARIRAWLSLAPLIRFNGMQDLTAWRSRQTIPNAHAHRVHQFQDDRSFCSTNTRGLNNLPRVSCRLSHRQLPQSR